jgi:hypothetical protein
MPTPAKAKTKTKKLSRSRRGRSQERDVLTSEWCAWIANNVVRGVAPRDLLKTLVSNDVPRSLATRAVDEIAQSPALHGVLAAQQERRAGDLRARLMRELGTAKATRGIERRKKPSADELFDRYWARNEPVVFTDATKGWKLWTPQDMKRLVGDVEIVVTEGREADPHYDERFAAHAKKTTVGAFVDRIRSTKKKKTNDFYMVAQSKTMDRPEMSALLDRIVLDKTIFDPKRIKGGTSLWLGPKGTVTPLHHDGTNIFFAQIYGRKQFLLASPHEDKILESARGYYSDVDPEKPDLDLHPWWKDVTVHRVVLEPGEVLFLPVAWWHHVRSLDVSISLSLLNFRRPNAFDWYRPGFR